MCGAGGSGFLVGCFLCRVFFSLGVSAVFRVLSSVVLFLFYFYLLVFHYFGGSLLACSLCLFSPCFLPLWFVAVLCVFCRFVFIFTLCHLCVRVDVVLLRLQRFPHVSTHPCPSAFTVGKPYHGGGYGTRSPLTLLLARSSPSHNYVRFCRS